MADSTTNYGLVKPADNEFYDIQLNNANMDVIDGQMKSNADAIAKKADLVSGVIPESQLPPSAREILEFTNTAAFPATGEAGKIYVATDTNRPYRWTGTGYAEISASIALGETSSTAYRGDRGKAAYDHTGRTDNPHNVTAGQVGAATDADLTSHETSSVTNTEGAHGLKCDSSGALSWYDKSNTTWLPVAVGAPKLQQLVITSPPNKTAYRAGETFIADGMVMTANYSQSASAPVTGYKITPSGPLTAADKYVTVAYTENGITKTVQQPITVGELSRIDITTPPTKTAYAYGDYFDTAGMVVRATFSGGSTENITAKITYSPASALTLSNTAVTVSYIENGIAKTAAQAITVTKRLTSIAIITPPGKTEYIEGETFSTAGMAVRGYYNDGSYSMVSGYTYTPAGALATTDTSVTLTYTENGVAASTSQTITVKPNVSQVLNDNDWETIARVAEAGEAQDYWSVGDEKDITLTTGETLTLQIYGFAHDNLADGSGKAPITFGMKNLMADVRRLHSVYGPSVTLTQLEIYNWLTNDLWNSLPADLRNATKSIKKTSVNIGETVSIFLFSARECGGTATTYSSVEGEKYPIFTDILSVKKSLSNGNGAVNGWWTRSVCNSPSSGQYTYCYVITNGAIAVNAHATIAYGVCFGFCV